ncbi:MAG: hypothetical protein IJB50_00855 [Clostridia bacterium]|nr:hypothetical protein [Clostridia bacterium]
MDKEKILTRICDAGIVAVVRAENAETAVRITDACIEGGVAAIELTFTVPGAHRVIEELAKRYTPDEIILGAGTICGFLDGKNFKDALEFGVVASALKHTIPGDFNLVSRKDVENLVGGDGSGRVQR